MPTEEELYQEHILDHYEDPFHRGHLPTATHAHEDKNPLCGDVVRMELEIDREGKIAAEAERLYLFISEQVNKFRGEHNEQEKSGNAAKRA